jgi:hypothetical protein
MVFCGVWLLLLGTPGEARASSPQGVNPYIPKAEQLFDNLKYRQALKTLEKAARWPSNTPEQNVSIALLQGVLHCEIGTIEQNAGETQRCVNAFQRALAIDPKAQLSFPVSPKITEQLERVRKDVVAKIPVIITDPALPRVEPENLIQNPTSNSSQPPPTNLGLHASLSRYRLPIAIAGGGVAMAGALSWVRAKSLDQRVRTADSSITTRAQLEGTLREGRSFETVGWVLLGTGAATALGSMLLLSPSTSTPTVLAGPTDGGAHMTFHWSIP